MHKLLLLLFVFHIQQSVFAQNLIPNYSFENYSDELIRKSGLLTIYFNQNSWISYGSIDLFSSVNETLPCNQFGNACPVSGKAYMGMNAAYPREIAQVPLKKALEKNKRYCISFYVSTSFKTDTAVKLRVLFSDTLVVNFSGFVFFPKTIALTECANSMDTWKKVHAFYTAKGGENYLCIGNFDDEHDPVRSDKHKWHDSYYFIDDVVLKEVAAPTGCGCNSDVPADFFPLENGKCRCADVAVKPGILKEKALPVSVFFETSKYSLDKISLTVLDSLVTVLTNRKSSTVIINGYADVDGTEPDNDILSLNRANAVADYFLRRGIEKERTSVTANGSSGSGETPEIKSRNRKVEIQLED